MRAIIAAFLLVLASPTFADEAQVQQRILAMTQAQRNQLLDGLIAAEARVQSLSEELAKAQARIRELEPKPEANPEQKH